MPLLFATENHNLSEMNLKFAFFHILFLFFPVLSQAQFYVTGDDPGRLKWNTFDTESYRVIYPQGADSLAFIYGTKLEKYKLPVSRTSGYMVGKADGKMMPVVLHAYNDANGSVAWAPRRMDLFTLPSSYRPEPLPWSTMLAVHESRHVTQMQFGMTRSLKPFNWAVGEMWNMVTFLLYPGLTLMEGDAVVAETALTPSGRGRIADFLNYYWVAFDRGDNRNWFQWRFVSQKHYSPSYYALGYLTIGGFRYLHDHPYFVKDIFTRASTHPYDIGAEYTTTKRVTGKRLNAAFHEVKDTMYALWCEQARLRAPYMPSERLLPENQIYTDYTRLLPVGKDLYAVKKGHVDVPVLIRIDSTGKENRISAFSHDAGALKWSDKLGKLYWSEILPDERWTLGKGSRIRFMAEGDGKKQTLAHEGMLHNPVPDPEGETIAAICYFNDGRSALVLTDLDGRILASYNAPAGVQLVECAWIGNDTYATGISDNGYGIYAYHPSNENIEGRWKEILDPQPVMVKDFSSRGCVLTFTCDRTGADEHYYLYPSSKVLKQKTSTRYGATDYCYDKEGKYLYYSSQTIKGRHIFRTPVDSLFDRDADWHDRYLYPIAEKITRQENEIAAGEGRKSAVEEAESVYMTEPARYRKAAHLFNIHSWAPVYVSVNNIMNMSFDYIWQAASLGATAIMQNRLATATGEFGYSAHRDPINWDKWRNSGHFRFTYSGLYPIFEFSLDVNDRAARQYNVIGTIKDGMLNLTQSSKELPVPFVKAGIKTYIPFDFSSGGWHKGLIPQASYTITNDWFNTCMSIFSLDPEWGSNGTVPVYLRGAVPGKNHFRHYFSTSVRGYTMMSIPNSSVFPRWGIGAEIGYSAGIESYNFFSPAGYIYGYGYVPGLTREHGVRLTAIYQRKIFDRSYFGQAAVNTLPRGLSGNSEIMSWLGAYNKNLGKVTVDYAVPVYIGDITIGGNWLAIKRLVVSPYFDLSLMNGGNLWSAGVNLALDLHAIITMEWPCSFGITGSYNGGSTFSKIQSATGVRMNKWFVGPTFNVSF